MDPSEAAEQDVSRPPQNRQGESKPPRWWEVLRRALRTEMERGAPSVRSVLPILIGLLLGIVAGVAYTWLISPVVYVETTPNTLRMEHKDAYRALIAAAFVANGDLGRAQARLDLLQDPDPQQELVSHAQRLVAGQGSYQDARSLALLAAALSQLVDQEASPAQALLETNTPVPTTAQTGLPTSALTATPSPTLQPTPTRAPSRTPGMPFVVREQTRTCNPDLLPGLLQVNVIDQAGQPVPGLEVQVTWEEGQDRFFTGLKPEYGLGYADFDMQAGVEYALRLAEGSEAVTGLVAEECTLENGTSFLGGWSVTFAQP